MKVGVADSGVDCGLRDRGIEMGVRESEDVRTLRRTKREREGRGKRRRELTNSNENFSRLELRGLSNGPSRFDFDRTVGLVEDNSLKEERKGRDGQFGGRRRWRWEGKGDRRFFSTHLLSLGDIVGGLGDDLGRHGDESS